MHYTQTAHATLPSPDLISLLTAMPKVEIHVHLEAIVDTGRLAASGNNRQP